MPYTLNVRSYAPFASFGGGFEGDARGPSASSRATSRIAATVVFNPQTGQVGKPGASSSGTAYLPLNVRGMGEPRATLVQANRIPGGVAIRLDVAGANPLVPLAPDIDLHADAKFTLTAGRLNVSLSLRGDAFPNAELFVADSAGNRRMILTYETSGGRLSGPALLLPMDRKRPMNAICISFPIDSQGAFR